jgi:hypothetical protein
MVHQGKEERMLHEDCRIDNNLLAPLLPCMGVDAESFLRSLHPDLPVEYCDSDGFPLCSISKRTVVYSCGAIARQGDVVVHTHPLGEVELCRKLASEATYIMEGVEVGMGSEGTPHRGSAYYLPFFRAAKIVDSIPVTITEELIWEVFGGTLCRKCSVHIESLEENTEWWSILNRGLVGLESDYRLNIVNKWKTMIQWLPSQPTVRKTVYVRIRDYHGECGAVFPQLALALTESGSVAGILGNAVYT